MARRSPASASDRKADAKAAPTTPAILAVPSHGHGKLRRSGPSPGSGRRPEWIRRQLRTLLSDRLPILARIADGDTVEVTVDGASKTMAPSPRDQLAALEMMAKHGLGEHVSVTEIRERLRRQLYVIREQSEWRTDDLITALEGVWA